MKKIKVLHISPDSMIHGTERHILSIVKYSDRNKIDNYVVTPSKGIFNEELDKLNIKNFTAGRKHGYNNKFQGIFSKDTRELYRLIKNEKFDIVHTHLNSFGGLIGKLAGVKIIIHTRHGVFWSEEDLRNISFIDKNFQKLKSDFFDMTIALGKYEKKILIEKFGYAENKVRTTINGVDIDEINSRVNRSLTKKELFGTNEFIIGTAGRLERQKGLDKFIDAISLIKENSAGIKFVIIGNGSLKEELIDKAKKSGVEENIIFMDYKKNILDYVNNFDIMVLTSLWEGLSYSVQEAMALGKAVIALVPPDVSGVKEIIVDNESGYLIYHDFVKQLSQKMLSLSKAKEKLKQTGNAAIERERTHFPEWRTAKDMDEIYIELYNSGIK